MKAHILSKLKTYSLSAGALVGGAGVSQSQILYTDVNPDSIISGNGNSYNLDLNNDNVTDFVIDIFQSSNSGTWTFYSGWFAYSNQATGIRISPQGYGNAVLGWTPMALESGFPIASQLYGWNGYGYGNLAVQSQFFMSYFFSGYYGTYSGSWSGTYSNGNFVNAQDKYVGLRLQISGNNHLGWARLDVPSLNQFVIKDYALNLTANQYIFAGDTGLAAVAGLAGDVSVSDIQNNGNGSDLLVEFNAPSNEATVLFYKLIVVKDASAGSFNLSTAQNLPSGRYYPLLPTGASSYTEQLYAGLKDSDGDAITVDIPYRVFVHSVSNPNAALADGLSASSDTVMLEQIGALGPVQFVSIYDVANNGNGLDLEVNFNPISDEGYLEEYRIFIVKSSAAQSFGLSAAQTNNNYKVIQPSGMIVSTVLTSAAKDTDGELIKNGVPYRAFVMSVADGINALDNYLSPASNSLTLSDLVGINQEVSQHGEPKLLMRNGSVVVLPPTGQNFRSFELYSLDGKRIANRTSEPREVVLQKDEYPAGMYVAKMVADEKEFYLKMVLR